jgi:hypothetical protein
MANLQTGTPDRITRRTEMKWSPAEKSIARQAFDRALQREFESVIRETKRRSAEIQQPDDLWDLERYLREQRTAIDRQYDYRYSVLPFVFADLIRAGRLTEDELRGIGENKLAEIRYLAAR